MFIPSCLGGQTKGWRSESQHQILPYYLDPQAEAIPKPPPTNKAKDREKPL